MYDCQMYKNLDKNSNKFLDTVVMRKIIKFSQQKNLIFHDR